MQPRFAQLCNYIHNKMLFVKYNPIATSLSGFYLTNPFNKYFNIRLNKSFLIIAILKIERKNNTRC